MLSRKGLKQLLLFLPPNKTPLDLGAFSAPAAAHAFAHTFATIFADGVRGTKRGDRRGRKGAIMKRATVREEQTR